mmetsp:Transcript_41177/g.66739  ORF Transcript_41177/g.66739 Transcript_41177/m.66739 type:complete len:202 (-) Transcript_41177:16-621(-)
MVQAAHGGVSVPFTDSRLLQAGFQPLGFVSGTQWREVQLHQRLVQCTRLARFICAQYCKPQAKPTPIHLHRLGIKACGIVLRHPLGPSFRWASLSGLLRRSRVYVFVCLCLQGSVCAAAMLGSGSLSYPASTTRRLASVTRPHMCVCAHACVGLCMHVDLHFSQELQGNGLTYPPWGGSPINSPNGECHCTKRSRSFHCAS